MIKENYDSVFMENIQKGIKKGIITVTSNGSKITYHCKRDYTTSFKNPEEKVRASYFVELVLDYNYSPKNIDIEVIVPRRTPEDRSDIKDGITDAVLNNWLGGVYLQVIVSLRM